EHNEAYSTNLCWKLKRKELGPVWSITSELGYYKISSMNTANLSEVAYSKAKSCHRFNAGQIPDTGAHTEMRPILA
ncbi:hypothetical protein CEXT_657591, partial [Caerostris extrusa]